MQENYLEVALASLPVEGAFDGLLKYSGVVKAVLAGLKDKGLVAASWGEVLQITLLVIDLIQQIGPQIEEIVAKVIALFGR